MRFPHLTLFMFRFLRVPTPFPPLNRVSHSSVLTYPEDLHSSETFSLDIQIKTTHMRIPCLMLLFLQTFQIIQPLLSTLPLVFFMTLFSCIQYPVLSDIPYVFCSWSSSDCYTSGMCHNSWPHFPSSNHPDHILFCFVLFFPLVYLCKFYENLDFPFPGGVSPLSFNLGVSQSYFSPDMSYSQIL